MGPGAACGGRLRLPELGFPRPGHGNRLDASPGPAGRRRPARRPDPLELRPRRPLLRHDPPRPGPRHLRGHGRGRRRLPARRLGHLPVGGRRAALGDPVHRRPLRHDTALRLGRGGDGLPVTDVSGRALGGVRVVELSIGIAAPSCGRVLAFHGADVLKVESRRSPETIRLMGSPWARSGDDAAVFVDTSPFVAEFSSGKRSVGLELKHPAGLEALHRLVRHSDVLLTNLSAPAVRRLGLGDEEVRRPAARPHLRRPARVRLRRLPALPRVRVVGAQPGTPRRPRRPDRGAGARALGDHLDRPARLYRRPSRRGRRARRP
ncbi:MAG: hypothetical protein GEV08_05420 [Acidimicrobiia bacterium]|nr:hypothetical protein [Acidimicrobiia bacterium]